MLERIELGTPYPEVVDRVARVSHKVSTLAKVSLPVDGSEVGCPVVDLLKRAWPSGRLMPVLVTGGERPTRADDYYHVPKRS